jgi:NAD(P)-dependent dehydrogenase (short-subunit alcohol dehydrogenase family)
LDEIFFVREDTMTEAATNAAAADTRLASFPPGLRALVCGASGGIGSALVRALAADSRVAQVYAAARDPDALVGRFPAARVTVLPCELHDEASIAALLRGATAAGPLHMVLVASGLLHAGAALQPEKSWRALDANALAQAFAVNTIGPALIAKHALGALARDGKSVYAALSARVGSIEDNRLGGWHAYRASKAALNMLIRTFSIELRQRNPQALCVGLHPGTVDTALSKPFQAGVDPSKLFSPTQSAEALLGVLDRLTTADTGRLWAWDGEPIPF